MLDNGGELLPWTNWTGLFPEMIAWMAVQAGFTYELLSPSGNGSTCHPPDGAEPDGAERMPCVTQYGCAGSGSDKVPLRLVKGA